LPQPRLELGILELTPDQQRAARACGIAFFPATTAQVERLTMQRRIFWLGGQPFLATRDGGFWETHGTLLRIVEEQVPGTPHALTDQPARPPQPVQVAIGTMGPMPATP